MSTEHRGRAGEAEDAPAKNADQPEGEAPVLYEVEVGPEVDAQIAEALRRKAELGIPKALLDAPVENGTLGTGVFCEVCGWARPDCVCTPDK